MSELLAKQQNLLRSITRALDNFKKIGRGNYTPAKIRSRIASLKETWSQCLQSHAALLHVHPLKERSGIDYFKADQIEVHEEVYQTALDFMNDSLEEMEPPVSPNRSVTIDQSFARSDPSALSLRHLPPIKLPPFRGDFAEWESFRDRFTALIIENKELSDYTRMHFLASSLTGSALNAISGIQITANNFPIAWKVLQDRFENKRKLIDIHIAALYNLPPISRESAADLHSLRDTANKSIAALKCLGRSPNEILSDILVYFVVQKLDQSTRRAWKLKGSQDATLPSFDDLTQFMSSRALALEDLNPLNPRSSRSVKANNATTSDTSDPMCILCKRSHYFNKCEQFLSKSPSQRRIFVKQSNRCFNCLSLKHSAQNCPSKFSCRRCQKRHHSLLHIDSSSSSENRKDDPRASNNARVSNAAAVKPLDGAEDTESVSQAVAMSSVSVTAVPSPVLLATAKVIIESPVGRRSSVRAFLDQGSEVTFITEHLAQTLRLRRTRTFTTISAVGCLNAGTCRHAAEIKIFPRNRSRPLFSTVAYVLPSLTKYCLRMTQSVDTWSHLSDLPLADDDPTGSTPIDLIIGAELYSSIILNGIRRGPAGQPIAQNSHLGWIISGPVSAHQEHPPTVNVMHCSLDDAIRRFWEIEEVPSRQILSPAEQQCEEHFMSTHSRSPDGRYMVRLPFKTGPPISIGESRSIAIHRLIALHRRFNTNSELKEEYSEFISEYKQLDHMKLVPEPSESSTQTVYIPHHAVIRDSSSTTRLRVVFNASSLTANGTSLNSHLLTGSKLQTDLNAVITRWRQHKYVYIADIAKMYRQILIDPRDRDYQRIVWSDNDPKKAQDYQLNTVTYGTTSAPFLALRVIRQLVRDDGDAYPLAGPILEKDTFVDDVLFGAEDIPLLKSSRDQVCTLLANGGFTLRKWASNKSELLADIPSENHGLACHKILQVDDDLSLLGLSWNPALDSFQFRISLPESSPRTKRTILSAIAKLFDPLGWVTPSIVTAKIFMQQLWLLKLDWDDIIPPPARARWETMYRHLVHLNDLRIPRWTGQGADTAHCELHGFSDASIAAYAAVVYMRVLSLSGEYTVQLLSAKSKVAPIKTITVPRLELSAAHLLARLLEVVRDAINERSIKTYCWTDSTSVLEWLRAHPSRWPTFVSNRTADIHNRIPDAEWRHVPTQENPADCASRGLLGHELQSFSLWWQGPPWLRFDETKWPPLKFPTTHDTVYDNEQPVVHLAQKQEPWDLASRYSSWPRLFLVTAYILRFVKNCRSKNIALKNRPIKSIALTADECQSAQSFWLRIVQTDCVSTELSQLQKGHAISPKSPIASLNPFLDEDGLMRVGGRISKAPLSFETKHPVILASHPVVKLIVRHSHLKSCHSGVQLTLATLRQQYWILRARSMVKQIIHKCVTCTREKPSTSEQLMGQLPQARVSALQRAFLHCGIDYAGPVATRLSPGRGIKSHKSYIALFICLASRAIHLELVSNYSASTFIDAFSRFCARRGLPAVMYSDNGTTFVGAEKELNQAYRNAITNPDFLNKTAADKISWKFIPPHAPHFDGLWEAGVRSVKHHLRRVLGAHTLTFEEFTTLLCRIEACLNSRPIGPLTDTLDDYEPLTPGHFLIGSALTVNPEPSVLSLSENRLSRWQQRGKWRKEQPSIDIGTMVLIKNPLLPPYKWELGRVTERHTGSDGLVRVVSVRTAQSEYKRPIVKLCLLPIEIESRLDEARSHNDESLEQLN